MASPPAGFWWLMLAFGFLIAVFITAIVSGARRRRDPGRILRTEFVPHRHFMILIGVFLAAILLAIVIPFLMEFFPAGPGR